MILMYYVSMTVPGSDFYNCITRLDNVIIIVIILQFTIHFCETILYIETHANACDPGEKCKQVLNSCFVWLNKRIRNRKNK